MIPVGETPNDPERSASMPYWLQRMRQILQMLVGSSGSAGTAALDLPSIQTDEDPSDCREVETLGTYG